MKVLPVTTMSLILLASLLTVLFLMENAYGHGVGSCLTSTGGCALGKNNEQYSDITLDMDDESNGVLTINGTIRNKYYDHELRLIPYLSVGDLPFSYGSFEISDLLRLFYPLYNDPTSWYFRVESDMSNPIIIKPREEIEYEIRAYPLKAGQYHVHSLFVFDYVNDERYRYYEAAGRGQTVTVTGSNMPTAGEITQLILPFSIGAIAIPVTVLKARKIAKNERIPSSGTRHSRIREWIRLYFAAKSSLETVWLAGLLAWFLFAAYPAFYPLESRILSMAGMIALMGAITVSGYIAAIAKSRRLQSIFAVGTAIASVIVYYLLNIISFYAFWHGGGMAFYYDLLPTSGVGYNYNVFESNNYPAYLAGFAANAIVAMASALTRREKYNTKIIAGLAAAIAVLVFVVVRTI